jgi:hypothetical protein
MKKKLQSTILFNITFIFFNISFAQTTIYSENFEGIHSWTLNVPSGTNGADPNFFTVSDNEGGVLPLGCELSNNGNKTLHIASVFNPNGGAQYDAGGLCGILFCPQTNYRTESPSFSTIGLTNITVKFDFIGFGDGLSDNASFWYNAGSGWVLLEPSLKSVICLGGKGQWTNKNIILPVLAENNPNVKIGFNWTNDDDGVGTNPSFAVNNIIVSSSNLSISEFDLDNSIKVYPNPSSSILKIESKNDEHLLIINQLGQKVKMFKIVGNIINEINIEDLPKGIYIIKNNQYEYCKKIIIE